MMLGRMNGKNTMRLQPKIAALIVLCVVVATLAVAQAPYQPKFPGDPARSDSEAQALGYMRTVLRAQKQYKKKYGKFANSLNSLVHTGSFTKRMAAIDRGDYKVGFRSKKDGFQLTMTPKELDAQHRSFYAEDDGIIHAEEDKAATDSSPAVK
jgi:type II secretory pathway pseudopilin PulG